jgi:hypothetical protein
MRAFLRDLIQAPLIGLVFWWSLEPSREISQDYQIITTASEIAGSIGKVAIQSSWLTIPVLVAGMLKYIFRRSEHYAERKSRENNTP